MLDDNSHRPVPARALGISVVALAVPAAWGFLAPVWMTEEAGILVWLIALVPAFLLTYYRGRWGASVALAAGMAVLSVAQVSLLLLDVSEPNWGFLVGIVVVYIAVSLALGTGAQLLQNARSEAVQMALTDPLTGLPNRRHATLLLDRAFASADRGIPLCVALFDLDHFKQINDTHGHEAGDDVLRGFAKVLETCTRRMNLSARFGGEEFLSILTDSEPEGALSFAERVRGMLVETDFPIGTVTVSCGVAAYEKGMGAWDFLVGAADQALYAAKEGGRNRVVLASIEPAIEASNREAEPGTDRAGADQRWDQPTVLLVEDDDRVRRTLARALSMNGCTVLDTGDPNDALELFSDDGLEIALLITDVVMPRMSGLTLAERALKIQPGVPVLYISGHIRGKVSWAGLPSGATGFVEKPVSTDDLIKAVQRLIEDGPGSKEDSARTRVAFRRVPLTLPVPSRTEPSPPAGKPSCG